MGIREKIREVATIFHLADVPGTGSFGGVGRLTQVVPPSMDRYIPRLWAVIFLSILSNPTTRSGFASETATTCFRIFVQEAPPSVLRLFPA
jgi:hypothetical protein